MKKLAGTATFVFSFIMGSFAQTKKPAATTNTQGVAERGKVVYTTYCQSCHQPNGGGVPNLNPPLSNTSYVLGDKTKLISILLKGMNEEVEISGNYFSNTMPAQNFLKDQEIADVLTYIRSNFGNKATAVSATEVKTVRKKVIK
ncbi:Cytochrome c, mono-and diheme variants [Filimonas lacunae]|uniref:Cytochrome c, mono-and diheme variants n=1 Tax=Filimonas lacunae TaxID=477680 RepID=A0A173MMK5_9BACT|nr:cytochrome c [Filimonas lacunae]BAV08699.1 copper-containing nitrite reductase [Filimonas lacunae]SIS60208.1 Cytochrome c, mono-and diheme variants [Filimonas lacunae]